MKITERKRWCHRWLLSLESEGQGRMMLKTIWKRRAMLQVPIEVKKMTDEGWWTDNHWELGDESGEEQKWWRRMRCWSQVRRWDDWGDAGRSKEGEEVRVRIDYFQLSWWWKWRLSRAKGRGWGSVLVKKKAQGERRRRSHVLKKKNNPRKMAP